MFLRAALAAGLCLAAIVTSGSGAVNAQDTAGEASPLSELVRLEESAEAAVATDPWLVSTEDLAAVEFAVSRNLAAQQAAAARAAWLADLAEGRAEVATMVRIAAQRRRAIVEDQLGLLTIEAFMFADESRIGGFGNELQQVRDVTPNRLAATSLIDAIKRLDTEVAGLERTENRVHEQARRSRQSADDRAAGLTRARALSVQFDGLKAARSDGIRLREQEVLEASERPGQLVSVSGFIVDASIAANVAALVAAAAEDGIVLQGWGYRTTEEQIALRLSHCGNSGDAIFDRDASTCSPPTANPLRSEHEKGLALDFTEGGATLGSSSPGFLWLQEHGAEYGFFNLPSEPWHWSTTGR